MPTKAERLFENLLTVNEFIDVANDWLRRDPKRKFNRNTVYKWVRQGMPKKKIRGELFIPKDEAAIWLTKDS